MLDESKKICPFCSTPYPTLGLRLSSGARIPFGDGVTELRRGTLGGSPTVSDLHAVVRRRGPEYGLESRGRNGSFRFDPASNAWVQLPAGREVVLRAGNKLRFADVEANVVIVK